MAALVTQTLAATGSVVTWTNASASDTYEIPSTGNDVELLVRNTSGSSVTLTVAATIANTLASGSFPAVAVPGISIVIAADAQVVLPPLPTCYRSTSNASTVTVVVSPTTGVQYAPVKRPT